MIGDAFKGRFRRADDIRQDQQSNTDGGQQKAGARPWQKGLAKGQDDGEAKQSHNNGRRPGQQVDHEAQHHAPAV